MPIAELFVGALITVLIERLASREVLNFARREGIRSQLEKWRNMLSKIQAVLVDAEHKQIREDSAVNLWLKDLRDLAYDVDDLLDEFAYDALAKINSSAARGESSKAQRLGKCFGACNPCVVISNTRMESKIKGITARFQGIVKEQNDLRLSDTPFGSIRSVGSSDDHRRTGTTCLVKESDIFGREKDKEAIVQLLLQGRDQVEVGVLPIIGMGGLGKTTLAQLVYNDNTVEDYFPVRAWTCVSDDFDPERITRSILVSLKRAPTGTDLNSLQVELKEALFGKKFLIILDDVWNEEYGAWESLNIPFFSGLPGSMVIVTTRNQGVASVVRNNFEPYCLMQLSDDVCLSIFLRHAIGASSFEAHPKLADIGIKIVERCKGLPLAAKMLGGILRKENRRDQWLAVLHSDIWDLPESGILPALKLSYHHLPPHLKQCFAYCSLFPADYEFEKQDLILLWMAEGFLQPGSNQKKQIEELGSDYFDNLTSRSFFQPSSQTSTFVMHDLIHTLARHVASDAYLPVDNHNAPSQDNTIKVRHCSFVRRKYDTFQRFEAFDDMNTVRTFLALPMERPDSYDSFFLSGKVLLDLLPKLKRMRVLSLCWYRIKELPDSVGRLKHLRYLNMAGAEIESFPESITSLFNLLTLILRECKNLRELPSSIGNLVNLRHLDLDDTPRLLQMPNGIKKLTGLQKLSKFIVGKNEELGISDLKNLSSLRGKLLITGIHNVVDISSATHASLNSKDGLEELRMEWRAEFGDSRDEEIEMQVLHHLRPPKSLRELEIFSYRDEEIEMQVLHHLRPPKSLRELEIFSYGGKRLPSWIGDPLCAPNIVRLRIDCCKNMTSLPPLGRLPLLKELTLSGLDGVTSVGDELYGYDDPLFTGKAFPFLEKLSISDMLGWMEWSCSNGLDVLLALVLKNCPKLTGKLPSHIASLKEVHIENCPQLSTTPLATSSLASCSDLQLDECVIDEGSLQIHLSSLTKLKIANISDLYSLNVLNSLPCLHELRIKGCPSLVSFGEITLPSTLKSLELSDCEALEKLPLMHDECFLDVLKIEGCSSLEYFPAAKNLSIRNNEKLPEDIMVQGIESLRIEKCPSLKCFPARGKKLPSSLKSLTIDMCENLEILTEGMLMQDHNMPLSLEEIRIYICPSLTCFPTVGKLPTSLKQLCITGCSNLTIVSGALPGSSLENIHISYCKNLQEIPESIVHYNIPNLKRVTVSGCENLRYLPNEINSLTSIVELEVFDCPALKWSNIPQGGRVGLPFSLKELTIGKTPLLLEADMSKWGLDCLTSLQYLFIDGQGMDDVISFPEYDEGKSFFLPTSLTSLRIRYFNNLESLSNGLQELSFLRRLDIVHCPKLRSLPSLPSTLEFLEICVSPILEERCKKDGGDYWPSISHIPYVHIYNQVQ